MRFALGILPMKLKANENDIPAKETSASAFFLQNEYTLIISLMDSFFTQLFPALAFLMA